MKIIIFLSIYFLITCAQPGFGQCNSDELSTKSISKLATGFNFLKNYRISGGTNTDKVEYSYVFTKGTQYMITLCEQKEGSATIMVTIFDAKRNRVASNKIDGTLLSGIAYPCNATGIYYLQYTFEGAAGGCGGSALGFKK